MKTNHFRSIVIAVLFVGALASFISCSKCPEPQPVTITNNITNSSGPRFHSKRNKPTPKPLIDQDKKRTDQDPNNVFLACVDLKYTYFVKITYTDIHGFTFTSNGLPVEAGSHVYQIPAANVQAISNIVFYSDNTYAIPFKAMSPIMSDEFWDDGDVNPTLLPGLQAAWNPNASVIVLTDQTIGSGTLFEHSN